MSLGYFDTHNINEDISSPNFGERLVRITEEGQEVYVYRDPVAEYYWLDYSECKIFASQTFYNNECLRAV